MMRNRDMEILYFILINKQYGHSLKNASILNNVWVVEHFEI